MAPQTSDSTSKLQSSQEHGVGTKSDAGIGGAARGPGSDPHSCSQLTFNTGGETTQWGEGTRSRESRTAAWKSVRLGHTLTAHTHTDSERLKDSTLRHDTMKLLGESTGKTFSDINRASVSFGQFPNII